MVDNYEFSSSAGEAGSQARPMRGLDERTRAVLEERARLLSRPVAASQGPAGPLLDILEVGLADRRYGFAVAEVHEVFVLRELLPIPCTPPFVLGVAHRHGRVLPVLSLAMILGLAETREAEGEESETHGALVVLEHDGREVGLVVDAVHGVAARVYRAALSGRETLRGRDADYGLGLLQGAEGEPMVLLSGRELLADKALIVCDNVE